MKQTLILLPIILLHFMGAFSQTDEADAAMQQFRYREAIEWLQYQPETRDNLTRKATCYEKLYDYAAAIRIYKQLLEQEPDNPEIVIALAEATSQAGDADASLKYWKRATDLSPGNVYLQIRQTTAHYRAGDWKGTIENAWTVFQTDSVPTLLRMTGDAHMQTLQIDSGLWYYTETIARNPSDHLAVSKKANFFYSIQVYDMAIALTDEYLTNINPNQKTIGQLNGMAHYAGGNYKEAIDRLTKNTELGDSTYTTHYFLGMSYYASKLYFDATRWLGNAYRKDSTDINLLYYYGTALARTYDRKKGIEILLQGVDKIENMSNMLYDFELSLADAHSRSKNPAKAIQYYRSAYKRQPDKHPILYNIALAYESMDDPENAIAYYERFLKTAPKDMVIDDAPVNQEDIKKMTTTEAYYRLSFSRIQKLKEELFFRKGVK